MSTVASAGAGQSIPARITEVLQKMHDIYGANLVVTRLTPSQIDLKVQNTTDAQLIADMIQRKDEIFGPNGPITGPGDALGPTDFEIFCQQGGTVGQGLFLYYLPNTPDRQAHQAGFWFY
jgi:hypothetical protein